MTTSVRFVTSATVTLDAAGAGTVVFNGPSQWERIEVSAITLTCTGARMPEARLYGSATPTTASLLAVELNGAAGSFERSDASDVIPPGGAWAVRWTEGSPGAVATATLAGTHVRP